MKVGAGANDGPTRLTWVRWGLDPRCYAGLGGLAVLAATLVSPLAGWGMGLALVGAGFSAYGLAQLAAALAAMGGGPGLGRRAPWVLTVVLAKYPVLFGAWYLAQGAGKSAENGFLAGLLLVYSLAVGWAQAKQASLT